MGPLRKTATDTGQASLPPELLSIPIRQSGSPHPAAVHDLPANIQLRDVEQVRAFLDQNTDLIPIIRRAREEIDRYFEAPTVELEFFEDPEDPDFRGLGMSIWVDSDVDDALSRLDRFDNEWWNQQLDRVNGRIVIDVEFQ